MGQVLMRLVLGVLGLMLAVPGAGATGNMVDPRFRIDAPDTAKPYTHLRFNNRPENFQFVVMADRTGANREGVFEDAIEKINMLQPEFVISVGDLIGGYTTDTQAVTKQWDEFDRLVSKLEMPYFFVAGNHDLSNGPMVKIWEERRGRRYYHFLYHDVLFLVINTDDPFPVQMSAEQVAYFEKVLAEHPNPRWTFVFMHNPSWRLEPTERQRASGIPHEHRFSQFDALLKGRKYTVFAGHTHNYSHERRNGGAEHIVMATTGGGSDLRGARAYGEFDHIAWVTMTDNGPRIANLALDGILPADVRTVATMRAVNAVTRTAPKGTLVRASGATFTSATARLRLENPTSTPMNMRIEFQPAPPLTVEPPVIDHDLAPGATESVQVTLTAPQDTQTDDITAPVGAKWTATLDDDDESSGPLEVTGEFTITVDGPRAVTPAARAVTVDGDTGEWGRLPLAVTGPEPPARRWRGPADASYRWGVSYDDEFLYIGVRTRDDKIWLDPSRPPHQQDGVEFRLDARPDPERSRGRALWNYSDHGLVMVAPPRRPGGEPVIYVQPARLAGMAKVKALAHPNGISAEVAIPAKWLDDQQGTTWTAVRINACMHDFDGPAARKAKHLWWRPDWRTHRNVEGSGTFERK